MPTKKSWLERVKKFFGTDTKSKQEKKEKRKRWLSGRLKLKLSPALPAPSTRNAKYVSEVDEEHGKYVMAVAVATTIAAEAAVAAAQAAAQAVQLTSAPLSHRNRREVAATKIQIAFRGYLARKALRALKGLVILQALIRGQTVRRQTTMTLRSLQTLMNIQSAARASRVRIAADRQAFEDKAIVNAKIKKSGEMRTALQHYSGRDWDSSTLSKEDINAMLKSRLMAALKRERVIDYASYHQERRNLWRPTTPIAQDSDLPNQRWSWLDRWVEASPLDKDIYVNAPVPSPEHNVDDYKLHAPDSLVLLHTTHNPNVDENQLRFFARRSFNLARETESITSSPCLPSYMASTASTKARFRSMSTPKQRPSVTDFTVTEACSDYCSAFTNSLLSPLPASETGVSKTHRKSPSQWSQTGPVRSRRSSKYLSFDSECSLLNWDRHNVVRLSS